jgi:hypothetical protein
MLYQFYPSAKYVAGHTGTVQTIAASRR